MSDDKILRVLLAEGQSTPDTEHAKHGLLFGRQLSNDELRVLREHYMQKLEEWQ